MRTLRLAVTIALFVGLAGCGADTDVVMPDVVGQDLDVALIDIECEGFAEEVEILGGGLLGVIDESSWRVCNQTPAAGQVVANPQLTVDRPCEDGTPESTTSPSEPAAVPSKQPTEEPTQESEGPSPTEPDAVLTVENNEDLASFLATDDYDASEVFATEYKNRTVRFDGSVDYIAPHGDYKTRYDILISAGDYSSTSQTGPTFKFKDVNIGNDLHLTSANNYIAVGDKFRFTAQIESFNLNTGIFFLTPVSTETR